LRPRAWGRLGEGEGAHARTRVAPTGVGTVGMRACR